jgi:hypothetical protein
MGPAVSFDLSSTGTSSVSIPRLRDDGANWVDYAKKVEITMASKGIWKYVPGIAVALVPFSLEASVTSGK